MNVLESRSRRGKWREFAAAVVMALMLGAGVAARADEGGGLVGLRALGRELGQIAERAYPGVAVLRVEGPESAVEGLRESLRRRSWRGGGRSAVPERDSVLRRERFEGEDYVELFPEREIRIERDRSEVPEELRRLQELRGELRSGRYGQGLGIIVSAEGYIVTNHHIVGDAKHIEVKLADGRSFAGRVVGLDEATNIAVVKIEASELEPLAFGDSDGVALGDWVIGIGNPLGIGRTFSFGMVTGKHRHNLSMAAYEDYLQTSAAPSLGDGGGPLLDLEGKVVGMNMAALGADRGGAIGLAIPAKMIKAISEELIESGNVARGFLGIQLGELDAAKARVLGLDITRGVLVIEVVEDSAAARGGLEKDDVIVELEGEAVTSTWQFRHDVARHRPGSEVEIVVLRGRERKVLRVTLGQRSMGG